MNWRVVFLIYLIIYVLILGGVVRAYFNVKYHYRSWKRRKRWKTY